MSKAKKGKATADKVVKVKRTPQMFFDANGAAIKKAFEKGKTFTAVRDAMPELSGRLVRFVCVKLGLVKPTRDATIASWLKAGKTKASDGKAKVKASKASDGAAAAA